MILAGIDEAGYGPLLGPLVVGCCAIAFDAPPEPTPDGWQVLRRLVSATRDARRLHVNDSKKVYSPSSGLRELERSILAFAASRHGPTASLDELIGRAAAESAEVLAALPWYRPAGDERFPIACDPGTVGIASNVARVELAAAHASVVHLHAHVVPESRLNEMFATTRNKSSTSFAFVTRHLDFLLNQYADRDLVIYCDRQGGRSHYAGLLRQLFPDWSLEVTSESDERSEYRLSAGEKSAALIFTERAEAQCISVALASMLSKYFREALMGRFNAHWIAQAPTLKPTAGYWTDGQRFLRDLAEVMPDFDVRLLARTR